MIREIKDADELQEWIRRLYKEYDREQTALGNPQRVKWGGFEVAYANGDHFILDDTDETVVGQFSPDPDNKGVIFVPILLAQSKRIDSGEVNLVATQLLLSWGYTKAQFLALPNTNGSKAATQTKAVSKDQLTREVDLVSAETELKKLPGAVVKPLTDSSPKVKVK